jgi:ankyrin repeat protein
MSEFALSRRLHRELNRERPAVGAGLKYALGALRRELDEKAYTAVASVDWSMEVRRWVRWLDKLLSEQPLPPETEAVWFESPDVFNEPATSVAAYARLGPPSDAYGLESACTWPRKGSDNGVLKLPRLDTFLTTLGWNQERSDTEAQHHGLFSAVLAFSHAYALLLVIHGLPDSRVLASLSHDRGIGVVMGWKSGEVIPVGQLTRTGWNVLRKVRTPSRQLSEMSWDERRAMAKWEPRLYIRLGGDLEERDEAGNTVLLSTGLFSPAEVRVLLEAGADVRARARDGTTALHRVGACDLETLEQLVRRGADPHAKTDAGATVIDGILKDGRCSRAHLEFYERLGVRVPKSRRGLSQAMALVATRGVLWASDPRKIRGLLAYLIEHGHGVNARDEQGRSPLWLALEWHARELMRWRKQPVDTTSYGHDRVAMILLEHGADPRRRHRLGRPPLIPVGATPLMVRRYDDTALLKSLLKHGADPHARCSNGKTALDYARLAAKAQSKAGNEEATRCVVLLERAMRADRRS